MSEWKTLYSPGQIDPSLMGNGHPPGLSSSGGSEKILMPSLKSTRERILPEVIRAPPAQFQGRTVPSGCLSSNAQESD